MSAEIISMEDFNKGKEDAVQMEGDFCGQPEFEKCFRWGEKTSRRCMEEAGDGLKILCLIENLTDDLLHQMDMKGDDLKELIANLNGAMQSGIARFEGICPSCASELEPE